MRVKTRPGISVGEMLAAWGNILSGNPPMLAIEITRECPLHCPGCYAYDGQHLGGGITLRQLSDLLMTPAIARGFATPPADPSHCVFSRVSVNDSADLQTRVQPCFFGG